MDNVCKLNILFFLDVTPNLNNLATSKHARKLKFGTDTHKTYITNLA